MHCFCSAVLPAPLSVGEHSPVSQAVFNFVQCQDVTFECSIHFKFFPPTPNEFQFVVYLPPSAHYWIRALKRHEFRLEWGCTAIHQNILQRAQIKKKKGWMFWKCSRPKWEMRGICWFANGAEVAENIQHLVYKNTPALTSFFFFFTLLHSVYVLSPHFPIFLFSPLPFSPCIDKYSTHQLQLIFSKPSAVNCYILSYSEDAGTSTLYPQRKFPSNIKITLGYKTSTHAQIYKRMLECTHAYSRWYTAAY